MGKLRAKDHKPKKVNDFKKVKAKVGKKVNRGPVTVIKVKAKSIVMSVQKSLQEKSKDEISQITLLTRQFHHHSASNRLIALSEVKEVLENSDRTESYIALVLPAAMELLFDEDKDTRKALLLFVDSLTKKYSKSAFESIASVVSTYCCSGLTSLKKDIRHDALSLLLQFLTNGTASIFVHDLSKLLQHVAGLLSLSAHTAKAAVGSGSASHSKKGGGIQPSGRKSTDKKAPAEKSSFLVSTLEVLEALIKLACNSFNCVSKYATTEKNHFVPADNETTKGIVLIYPLKNTSVTLASAGGSGGSKGGSSSVNSDADATDAVPCLRNIMEDVCCRLSPIWGGLVHEGSVITKHALEPLCLISRIGVLLSELIPSLDSDVSAESSTKAEESYMHENFLVCLFSGFPYVMFESTVALPGSNEEMEAAHLAGMLNVTVSEGALLWCQLSKVTKLMKTSNERISLNRTKGMKNPAAALESVHLESAMDFVHTSLTFLNDSLSNQALSPTVLMTASWDDYLQRLFRCISLEVLFLSEESLGDDNSSSGEAVGHVLNDLCTLIRFSVEKLVSSIPLSRGSHGLIQRLTFILKSSVTCASHITSSEKLMWENTSSNTTSKIVLLTETLSLLPRSMNDLCRRRPSSMSAHADTDESLSDSEYVVYISLSTLLLLLRRCEGSSEDDHTDSEDDGGNLMQRSFPSPACHDHTAAMWSAIVAQVSGQIAAIFAEPKESEQREGSVYVSYSYPIRMILLDIWYYCRFDNFEAVAEDSIVSIAGSSVISSIEQEKMLYLLFLRRGEMGVTAFVSSMIRGFEAFTMAIGDKHDEGECESEVSGDESKSETSMDVDSANSSSLEIAQDDAVDDNSRLLKVAEYINGPDSCTNKIARTLYECGSSSSPHLIAKFTLRALKDIIAEQYEGIDLYSYAVGTVHILHTILFPFNNDDNCCSILSSPLITVTPSACDTAEAVLWLATDVLSDIMIQLLFCGAGPTDTTSRILKLGFNQLREGEALENSPLLPVLNGLVSQWSCECQDSEEGSLTRRFDVFVRVLEKVSSNMSAYKQDEMASLLDFMFEIVQYWKLSEDPSFSFYRQLVLEQLGTWLTRKSILGDPKIKEHVDDVIRFIKSN